MTGKEFFLKKTNKEKSALLTEYTGTHEWRHNKTLLIIVPWLMCAILLVLVILMIAKLIVPSFGFDAQPVFSIVFGVSTLINVWYAFKFYPKFYKWIEQNKLNEIEKAEETR